LAVAFVKLVFCVLIFLLCFFQPPFAHSNKQKLQQKIIKDKIKLPSYLTSEANLFLKGVS
jgi:p70 ribosomal S6 kinase